MALTVKPMTHYDISVPDKPGELAKFTRRLKETGINLLGLWGFGVGQGQAHILCVPQDSAKFKSAAQSAGWNFKEGKTYFVTGEDRPGALCELLDKVASAGINLHALDALSTGSTFGAYLWTEEKDVPALGKVLGV